MLTKEKIGKIIDLVLEIGWLSIIFLIPLYFNFYHSFSIFALGKMVLFRILTEILMVLFLIKILFYSIKINFSFKKLLPFILFFLVTSLATLFSPYLYQSFWGSFFRHFGLFSILHYFAFFVILIFCLKDQKQIKRIILAVLLSSFFACLYALAQIFDLDKIKWIESFSKTLRVFSTFGQPNFFGSFLVLVFPLTVFSFKIFANFWQRIFLFALCFLEIFSLVFTSSRASFIGFAALIVFFFFFYFSFFNSFSKRKRIIILSSLVITVFLGVIGIFFLKQSNFTSVPNLTIRRISSIFNLDSPSTKIRLIYWKASLKIIKERPILGYGLDTQIFSFYKYYSPEASIYEALNSHPDRAHNEILDTLITTGFLGLISYLFLIGFVFYQGFKKKSLFSLFLLSALFGYLVTNQFGFAVTSTMLYFWLYIALIIFESNKNNAEQEFKIKFSLVSKALILLFFITTAFILVIYKNINLIKADYYFYNSRADFNKKNLIKLINDYEFILKYNPNEAYYYAQEITDILILTEKFKDQQLKKDFLNMALEDTKNISESKENLEYLLYKGQLLSAYGLLDKDKFETAENLYLKISQISPKMAVVYNDWGRMYILEKDYQKAIEKLNEALIFYPINHKDVDCCGRKEQIQKEMSIVYYNLGDAYFFQNNYTEAIKYYQLSLKLNPYNTPIFKSLADAYYLKGDLRQATQENLNGFKREPKNKEWRDNLYLLYKEQGNSKLADKYKN